MKKEIKNRIDHWIDIQKSGTLDEIIALQSPQEYCGNDDKPYITKRMIEENDAIQANKEQQWANEHQAVNQKYAQRKAPAN